MSMNLDRLVAYNERHQEKVYWTKKLEELDFSFSDGNGADYSQDFVIIDPGTTQQLDALANGSDHRLVVVLMSALLISLKFIKNQKPYILSPIFAADDQEGLMNKLLVLSIDPSRHGNVKEFLGGLRDDLIESTKFQNFPIDMIKNPDGPETSLAPSVMFGFYPVQLKLAFKADIDIQVSRIAKSLRVKVSYNKAKLSGEVASSLLNAYVQVIKLIGQNKEERITNLEFFIKDFVSSGDLSVLMTKTSLEDQACKDSAMNRPKTALENELSGLWQNLLSINHVEAQDNFFVLGGHSLNLVSLVNRIREEMRLEVRLLDFFEKPTLAGMATVLSQSTAIEGTEAEPVVQEYRKALPAQKRLYLLCKNKEIGTAYNLASVIQVEGEIDVARLEGCVNQLIDRHEVLRSSFHFEAGEIRFKIHPMEPLRLSRIESDETQIDSAIEDFIQPFDLDTGPLFRVGLLKAHANKAYLVLDMHHIVGDGLSLAILSQELVNLYHQTKPLESASPFLSYVDWFHHNQSGLQEETQYWLDQLSDYIPLDLSTDFTRPKFLKYAGNLVVGEIPTSTSKAIDKATKALGITEFALYTAALNVLLFQYTDQKKLFIGTPVDLRKGGRFEKVVGPIINTIVLKNVVEPSNTVEAFLQEVNRGIFEGISHSDAPFEEILSKLDIEVDPSRHPVFDVMILMENFYQDIQNSGSVTFARRDVLPTTSKFDLTFNFRKLESSIQVEIEYNTTLFTQESIDLMLERLIHVVGDLCEKPMESIGQLSLISAREKKRMLEEFSVSPQVPLSERTIPEMFSDVVSAHPQQIAIVCQDRQITYEELDRFSNRIANTLKRSGAGKDTNILILLDRSYEMIASLMAVLKLGLTYVPLDPGYPQNRIVEIARECDTNTILTNRTYQDRCADFENTLLVDDSKVEEAAPTLTTVHTDSAQTAYVIFTSGSTGKPKGIKVSHRNMENFITAMQTDYPLTPQDRILFKTPITFDVSVMEVFVSLMSAAQVVVLPGDLHKDPRKIIAFIEQYGITLTNFVPSMFKVFLDSLENTSVESLRSLKALYLAGEALPLNLVERFYAIGGAADLVNLYGPTEATVFATSKRFSAQETDRTMSIGRPLTNVQMYLLHENLDLCPTEIHGDVYIGGGSLSQGYLNDEEKTQSVFTQHPTLGRLYKTGDIGRWLTNGEIEYLGRSDQQVKIRGFRVEKGEIENRIQEFPGITEAHVIQAEAHGGELRAFYTAQDTVAERELEKHLRQYLPDYSIPNVLVQLETFPINSSGKVDLQELLAIQVENWGVAPPSHETTALEQELIDIWSRVLEQDQIDIDSDFFKQGGNSLTAISIDLELEKSGFVVDDLIVYEMRTVRMLAEHIEGKTA